MPKKNSTEALAAATPAKRTPEEKAQRKADKAGRRVTKSLTDDRAEKKASQKQTLKSAAKQLQKELDARMNEVVDRIRKETKAKLKEVIQEATRRLDVDTERMFEQALHTIVRHYDSIAPGRTTAINLPAPSPLADATPPRGPQKDKPAGKADSTKTRPAPKVASSEAEASKKRTNRPTSGAGKPSNDNRGPGRPKRQPAAVAAPELSTPEATSADGVAVDTV